MSGNIELGRKFPAVRRPDLEMDVRGSARVGYRRDCPESVPSSSVRCCPPEPLKIGVGRIAPGISGMPVDAVRVALPDLDAKAR